MTSNARRIHLVQVNLFFNSAVLVTFHGEAFPSFSLWKLSAAAQHALAIETMLVVFPLGIMLSMKAYLQRERSLVFFPHCLGSSVLQLLPF